MKPYPAESLGPHDLFSGCTRRLLSSLRSGFSKYGSAFLGRLAAGKFHPPMADPQRPRTREIG